MRLNVMLTRVTMVAFAALLGLGEAGAQAGPVQGPPAAQPPAAAPANLSMGDMVTQAETVIGQVENARTNVRRQLEIAREQRDVVKTLCLNDKLNQLDVAIRSARERKAQLDLAVSRNDSELARHEFAIIAVLRQRSDQLTAEANQCVGKEIALIGESSVTHEEDPDLPSTEVTDPPTVDVIIDPPSCSSCIK